MKQLLKILCTTSALAVMASGAAYAAPKKNMDPTYEPVRNSYIGVSGDFTWLRHSDTGGGGNVKLGQRFDDWRVEAEAGYHTADGNAGFSDTHYITYMGNAFYDFNKIWSGSYSTWRVTPYVGGGAGMASVHRGTSGIGQTFRHSENQFAYQGLAGLTFASSAWPTTDWTVGYRYLGSGGDNLHANNLEVGLKYHF